MAGLAERVAVVTGGSSGNGRAIVARLSGVGVREAIADVNATAAARAAEEIQAAGGTALAIPADVADSTAVDALFACVVEKWSGVDILVKNAGIGDLSGELRAHLEAAGPQIMGGARRSLGVTSRMSDA